jgi:hypothetical protein
MEAILPGPKIHRLIDLMYFNKSYWKIHHYMDKPVFFLRANHRVLFHDVGSALAIAEKTYPGDPNAKVAALLHIQVDNLCTANPQFKMQLESYVKLYEKRKRRKPKQKTADCLLKLHNCPCFLFQVLQIVSPYKASRICPRKR